MPRLVAAACLLSVAVSAAGAQGQYDKKIGELDERVAAPLALAFLHSPLRERLWCATAWTTQVFPTYTLIHVEAVREEETAGLRAEIDLGGAQCRDSAGTALPTIHSHPRGACQASAADDVRYMERAALFDVVLCGPRSTAWTFSKDLLDAYRTRVLESMGGAH